MRHVAERPDTHFARIPVRATERGELADPCALCRVWTVREGQLAEEWLVIRQEETRRSYALSNASANTSPDYLAWLKCVRHFRAEQPGSQIGGRVGRVAGAKVPGLGAPSGSEHPGHLVYRADQAGMVADLRAGPRTGSAIGSEVLPALSVANVRELLRATMPLDQLSPEQATRLVVKHLVNRSHSTSSRLKAQRRQHGSP